MTNPNRPLTSFRFIQTNVADTLQRLAARHLGDASRWPDIAAINGLSWPYFTNDPDQVGNGIVLYGSSLKVPSASSPFPATITSDETLGTDILLSAGMLADDGSGDFATVSGSDNYRQAAKNVLETTRQELLWHLRYGSQLRRILGKVSGPTAGILAKGYAAGALLADSRTLSVPDVQVRVSGASISVTARAVTVNGDPVTVQAQF